MRVAIDAHTVGTQLAGNVTYITNMIASLAEIDQRNEYTLYVMEPHAIEIYQGRWSNFTVRRFRHRSRILRYFYSFSSQLRLHPADIFFCQFNAPPFCPAKIVTAIHDLAFEHLPETFNKRSSAQMKVTIRRTARKAKHIITCSEYSRNDVIETYGILPEKVTNVYLAANDSYKPVRDASTLNAVRARYGLDGEFILGVGSVQPRKNLVRLIQAYGMLIKAGTELPPLVLVGKNAWLFDESIEAASNYGVEDRVHFTGFVPDEDLPALYSSAKFFVYPSFFEGFGLPPLEAMQCGTPVIVCDRTSLPEVVGDAGIKVDPYNVPAIAEAIKRLNADGKLRDELRLKGLDQAKKFSWKRAARETLDVFEKVDSE